MHSGWRTASYTCTFIRDSASVRRRVSHNAFFKTHRMTTAFVDFNGVVPEKVGDDWSLRIPLPLAPHSPSSSGLTTLNFDFNLNANVFSLCAFLVRRCEAVSSCRRRIR